MKIGLALILGAWLAGSLMIAGVATKNFFIIDDMLHSPATHSGFQKDVAQLGADESRTLLRYFSSELNRFYFKAWGWIDLGMVSAMLLLAGLGSRRKKFLIATSILFALTLITTFYLTPQIVDVGRTLDFVPRIPPPPDLKQFGYFHAAYSTLDMIKLLIGIGMVVELYRTNEI